MAYNPRDCSYEDMTPDLVHEEFEVPFHDEPYRNSYEETRYGSYGYDQSGMKGK